MPPERYGIDWSDVVWVLAMGAQGGFLVALPVLAGLGIGVWLDNRFGTLPWITIFMTLIGSVIGPILLYRWVTSSVVRRVVKRTEKRREGEEKAE